METEKPQKPLTNMQVWALEDEDMPDVEDDRLIEEALLDYEQESILLDDTPAGGGDK